MISLYHATAAAFLALSTLPPDSAATAPVVESPPKIETTAPVARQELSETWRVVVQDNRKSR